ncbi:MAG: N-acetyltransferase [Phycisphaerae bacterium]
MATNEGGDLALERSVRPATLADVTAIVAVHIQSFPDFFLTFLGGRFLRELYRGVIDDASGIVCVVENKDHLLGFVAGTAEPAGLYRRLLIKRWWRFGWASAGAAIKKPSIIPRLLRALRKPSEESPSREGNSALIMSIAVSPSAQGQGIGRLLVQAFCSASSERNAEKITLSTDKVNNEATNAFYRQLGFTLVNQYCTPEKREMNEYFLKLSTSTSPLAL